MTTERTEDAIGAATAAIQRLLTSLADAPSDAAYRAFKSAIQRRGRELADEYGLKALASVIADIEAVSGKKLASEAERIVCEAWDQRPREADAA